METNKSKTKPKTVEPKFLRNPIAYQGSKVRELHHIDEHKPTNFNKFIDVFGGGGSVALYFLQKYPNLEEVVYNDVDKAMSRLFTILKDETATAELLKWLGEQTYTEEEWLRRSKLYLESARDDTAERLYIKRLAFRGMESATLPNKKTIKGKLVLQTRKNYYDLVKYPPVLSNPNFKVRCECALKIIEEYRDDDTAFLYFDPPYMSSNMSTYGEADSGIVYKIMEIMTDDTIKCKMMIHIEFLGYTYDKLKAIIKTYYRKRYEMGSLGGGKELFQRYVMIATNYDT